MKIAVDSAKGGASPSLLAGVLRAVSTFGCEVALLGPEAALRLELDRSRPADAIREKISFIDAPEAGSTAAQACELAGRDGADAVVSLAPAQEVVAACLWHVKRLKGVLRPALVARFSTRRGSSFLIDAGANADCKPWHLLQFAIMGASYARRIHSVNSPRAFLLRSSAGDGKGTTLVQEAATLLSYSKLDFAGPVEASALMEGRDDIVLCDGYLGDIALRLTDAMVASSFEMLESALEAGVLTRLGARLSADARKRLLSRLAAPEHAAMPVLGLEKTVIACHRIDAQAIFHALRLAGLMAASPLQEDIRARIERVKSEMEFAQAIE